MIIIQKTEDRRQKTEDRGQRTEDRFSVISFLSSVLSVFLISIAAAGCGKPLYKDAEFMMGTFVEVISSDPRAKAIVFSEFKRLEGLFNLFDENSELSRLNAAGSLTVSSELFDILEKAKEFHEVTGGAFDVTVSPLSRIWKRAIKRQELPRDEEIKDALALVGFDYVYLDEKTSTVKLLKLDSRIDLGGIAKGYAVDRAVAKLKEAGISSAIVNAGGNLYCLGEHNVKPWEIGIQDPREGKRLLGKLLLKDKGVSTSGDYEQFFVFQNKRYSHIIDPKTGYPADTGIASATVIAGNATTADALSTSFIVLGKDKTRQTLEHFPGVRVKLIDDHGAIYDL